MRAMVLQHIAPLEEQPNPLSLVELPMPAPRANEVLIKVIACGVCRTELDEIEGRAPPRQLPIVLGHEAVGSVVECGSAVSKHKVGDRVGVGWIHSSSGEPHENLCSDFVATGRDVNGGYAEYMAAPESYAFPIPAGLDSHEAAPLLCAGSVGFRALRLANLEDGQPLGLMGFGGSNHLVLQTARFVYPRSEICVFDRSEHVRKFAESLGATWTGNIADRPPYGLSAVIETTPAWKPVVEALNNLRPGGRLVINAIRKESADKDYLLQLDYAEHLWLEREIKSVANVTGRDIAEFLKIAEAAQLRSSIEVYPLEEANRALRELKSGGVKGAKVLSLG